MASENDLQQQLEQIRKDVAALAETIASLAAGKAEDVKAQAYKAGNDAAEASAQVLDAARDHVCAVQSDLEERIRAKPLKALGIAAGLGFVLALLTRRA